MKNCFFQQEINLYKARIQDLDDLLEYHETKSSADGTPIERKPRRISVEKNAIREKYEAEIIGYKATIGVLENQNYELKLEQKRLEESINLLNQEKDELFGQNNHLNKKYACLVQEKEKLFLVSNNNNNATSLNGQSPTSDLMTSHISNHTSEGGMNSGPSSGLVSPTCVKKEKSIILSQDHNLMAYDLTDRLQSLEENKRDKEKMAMEDEIRILKEQIHKLILTNETLKLAKGGVEDKKITW